MWFRLTQNQYEHVQGKVSCGEVKSLCTELIAEKLVANIFLLLGCWFYGSLIIAGFRSLTCFHTKYFFALPPCVLLMSSCFYCFSMLRYSSSAAIRRFKYAWKTNYSFSIAIWGDIKPSGLMLRKLTLDSVRAWPTKRKKKLFVHFLIFILSDSDSLSSLMYLSHFYLVNVLGMHDVCT